MLHRIPSLAVLLGALLASAMPLTASSVEILGRAEVFATADLDGDGVLDDLSPTLPSSRVGSVPADGSRELSLSQGGLVSGIRFSAAASILADADGLGDPTDDFVTIRGDFAHDLDLAGAAQGGTAALFNRTSVELPIRLDAPSGFVAQIVDVELSIVFTGTVEFSGTQDEGGLRGSQRFELQAPGGSFDGIGAFFDADASVVGAPELANQLTATRVDTGDTFTTTIDASEATFRLNAAIEVVPGQVQSNSRLTFVSETELAARQLREDIVQEIVLGTILDYDDTISLRSLTTDAPGVTLSLVPEPGAGFALALAGLTFAVRARRRP